MILSNTHRAFNYGMLVLFSAASVTPIVGIALLALRDPTVGGTALSLGGGLHPENIARAWVAAGFEASIKSSVIVAIAVVLTSSIASVLAGFAFGAMRFRGSSLAFYLLVLGLMLPQEATIIPLFYGLNAIGLTDTYWALILPQVGQSVPFGAFWMRAFFRSAPRELIDAARIDGAGAWSVLWRVLAPLARPAITSMVLLFFVWTWNEFLLALVLVSSEDLRTAPVGLTFFRGRYNTEWTLLAAGSLIVATPVVVTYLFMRRHFIRGVLQGAFR
jgi:raffinose/stachyose/melibiose transport system permease protein